MKAAGVVCDACGAEMTYSREIDGDTKTFRLVCPNDACDVADYVEVLHREPVYAFLTGDDLDE